MLASFFAIALAATGVLLSLTWGAGRLIGLKIPTLALLCLVIVSVNFALVTKLSGRLWVEEGLCPAYDSLGKHMLHGSFRVDPEDIQVEAFGGKAKDRMYFGPLPAFFRIPLNLAFPALYKQWGRFSCLFAALILVAAFMHAAANALAANASLGPGQRKLLFIAATLGVAFGTTVPILLARSMIYHEAIIWGLGWSVFALLCIDRILTRPDDNRARLLLSVAAGCALLSRVTFAIPLYFILFVFGLRAARSAAAGLKSGFTELYAIALPALLLLGLQLAYNQARFGSVFCFIDETQRWNGPPSPTGLLAPPTVREALVRSALMFSVKRIPFASSYYFVGTSENFLSKAPFVREVQPEPSPLFFRPGDEGIFPITLSSSWLAFAMVTAFFYLLRDRQRLFAGCLFFAFICQSLLILTTVAVLERYCAEFLPAGIYAVLFWFRTGRFGRLERRVLAATVIGSIAISLILALTIVNQLAGGYLGPW